MGTCTEVSVQAAQIGCLDADFRQHVRPADIELRVIPSRSSSREAERVSSDSSHHVRGGLFPLRFREQHAIFAACGAYQLTGCHARRAPRGEVRLYPDGHFDIYVAEPGDRASRTSGSGICTVDLLLARGEH